MRVFFSRKITVLLACVLFVVSGAFAIKLMHIVPAHAAGQSLSFGPEAIIYNNGLDDPMKSHCDNSGACLGTWPDTPLSVVPNGSGFDWYASSGNQTAKTTGPMNDPAQIVDYTSRSMNGPIPSGVNYSAIGSVWQDVTDGWLFSFVHLERGSRANSSSFWASLGLAYSSDHGTSWTFLGEVFQHNLPYDVNATVGHEIGPGAYAIVHPQDDPTQAYFYLYAADAQSSGISNVAVARAKVQNVISAVKNHTALPTFYKYYNGAWNSPGIGGPSTNIVGSIGPACVPESISWNTALNQYVMAMRDFSSGTGIANLTLLIGTDPHQPTNFSPTQGAKKFTLNLGHDLFYASIIQPGSSAPANISGGSFNLYYVGSARNCGRAWSWACAYLGVRIVTVEASGRGNAQASSGFASMQGQNGWSYQYSTNGEQSFQNMEWDEADQRWQGTEQFCLVANHWQHPGLSCDSVRVWTSPGTGELTLGTNGPIAVPTVCGNLAGVNIRILKNGSQIWPANGLVNIANGSSYTFPQGVIVPVNIFDQIQFVVSHVGSSINCDATDWDPIITFQPGPYKDLGSSGFASMQGQNGWSYQYSTNGEQSFQNMEWDEADQRWQGTEQFCLVANHWQHPGLSCDSVRVWTSPGTGELTLGTNGPIAVPTVCGNLAGVNIRILKNGSQIWPANGLVNIANGSSYTFPQGVIVPVNIFDQIQFVISHVGSSINCDAIDWDPIITFQPSY